MLVKRKAIVDTHIKEEPSSVGLLACTTVITSLHLNDVAGEYFYVSHDLDPLLFVSSCVIFWTWERLLVLMIRDSLHIT